MDILLSSLLYYLIYFIAYQLFKQADRSKYSGRIKLFILLGMLVLCLFAGLRSIDVGTDTYRTVLYRFNNTSPSASLNKVLSRGLSEPILVIIPYFIKKITNDYRVYLFVLQALTVLPIGLVAFKLRKWIHIQTAMLVYMLLFFQISLNVMRQSIAAAWLLLAVVELVSKKYVRAILLSVLSTLFHGSVLIGIVLFLLVYSFLVNKDRKLRIVTIGALGIGIIFVLINWKILSSLLIENGFITDDYSSYISMLSGETGSKKVQFHYRTLVAEVLRLIGTSLAIINYKNVKNKLKTDASFYYHSIIVSFLIFTVFALVFNTYLGDRFTLYLDYCQIPLYALMMSRKQSVRRIRSKRFVIKKSNNSAKWNLVYCFIFNLFMFMIIGYGETVPYYFG